MSEPARNHDTPDHPPWEQRGDVRRDIEPDRSDLLRTLAVVSLVAAVLAPCQCLFAAVGLFLGVEVCVLATRDLDKMKVGQMYPGGAKRTARARSLAVLAVAISLLYCPALAGLLIYLSRAGTLRWGGWQIF